MSFILDKLSVVIGSDKSANSFGEYLYRTTDSKATVVASNYFNTGYTLVPSTDTATTTSTSTQICSGKFYVGDMITVQQVDSSNNPIGNYKLIVSYVETGSTNAVYVEEIDDGELVAIGTLTDVSTASNVDITFAKEVELTNITTYLGGAITVGDATLTTKEDSSSGDTVEGGGVTIAYSGSAKGDKDTATPYAQRTATTFNVATDGGSTGTQSVVIVLRGRVVAGQVVPVTIKMTDISTASNTAVIASPVKGTIKKIETTLQAVIASGDAAITTKIGTTAITSGALTIAYSGSAIGDIDTATPSAANVVDEGQTLVAVSDGGSTNTAPLYVTFYIMR